MEEINFNIPEFTFEGLDIARKIIIERRKNLSEDFIKENSKRIQEKIIRTIEFQNAKSIACFISFNGEPDTSQIINEAVKSGKIVCLPKIIGDNIEFWEFTGKLTPGKFGILEPVSSTVISVKNIEFFIVPGILFDLRGFRVGYGKGFYDKALKDRAKESKSFAIAWSFQVFQKIKYDKPEDIFVDKIFTEKFIIEKGKIIPY